MIKDDMGNEFIKFSRGESNSKGGLYSFDYGSKVLIIGENVFGEVLDETEHYV